MKLNNYSSHWASRAKTTLALLTSIGLLAVARAADPSASELLEKAIYSEETKGDIDAALQLYQQAVEEGKNSQAIAAQAQYRLGVCYYKKKDYAKANAAFEKLMTDYADQKDLVARAQEYLSGAVELMPSPWAEDEELRFDIKFPSGFRIGTALYSVHGDDLNGRKIWRLRSHLFAGVQQFSRVEVEADSFKPLHSLWKHTLIGEADTTYSAGHADLKMKGKDKTQQIELTGVIYDNEEAIPLFRRLPLGTNYSTTMKLLSGLAGGAIVPIKVEVPAIEKVETPAGTFECFRVELNIKQTFWYSTDSNRFLVKFEGGGVVAELAEISHRKANEPVTFNDASCKLSLSAPAGWLFDRHDPEDANSAARVIILDPDAQATSFMTMQTRESLKPDQKKSLRDWAESDIVDSSKFMKDVKVRPDSWKELTVAGQPAVSALADFVEGKNKKVGYVVYSWINGNAVEFTTYAAAADFDAFQPAFQALVASCKAQ